VPDEKLAHTPLWFAPIRSTLHSYLKHPTMFDELWSEIQDAPGEIFDMDIPELRDEKFDVNEYLNSNIDY
jgi:hypothetical protein